MANVQSYGQLISRSGAVIPVLNTATTEATEDNVQTDSNYVGSAQDVGTYGDQLGRFIVSRGGWICETDSTYNYIRSAGTIKAALPFGSGKDGGCSPIPSPLPYPVELASGDQLIVMANAVSDREASLTVACTNGEYHVFSVTPSGSGEHEFVSVLTGNGIGTTLQGRVCSHWMAYAGNNDAELTSSVMLLNGSGIPVGSLGFTNSGGSTACVYAPSGGVPIHLNSRAVFRTDG
ncbi:MAG: hypothetical protein NZ609_05030 [Acidimicrobiales bacterium]|jgi:hypothetical protein|nr:hypothetical protein [Acidimicrobiales bacterium]